MFTNNGQAQSLRRFYRNAKCFLNNKKMAKKHLATSPINLGETFDLIGGNSQAISSRMRSILVRRLAGHLEDIVC